MAVYKRNGKFYIKGRIKKMDGSFLNYNRLADNAKNINEARNYETDFLRKYQDIEISNHQITFQELCDKYMEQYVGFKNTSKARKKQMFNIACKTFGKDKINLITIASLRKYMSDFESKLSDYDMGYVAGILGRTEKNRIDEIKKTKSR